MWRRIYLLLLLVRLYFALSPSYLHPDENFQGPEVIAGQVLSYPVHHTWEFTAENPIRSIVPLWLVYGMPMLILRSLWGGLWNDELPPSVVYWTLRILMFTLSFVLEDWALQELVNSPRQRRTAMILMASSYVTWSYQTHTFSNAIETLLLLWCLVLISRILENKERSGTLNCVVLAFLGALGFFNRITFPAYLLVPGLQLLPHFGRKPFALIALLLSGCFFAFLAIAFDTSFYRPEIDTYLGVLRNPVITPLNNFVYNSASKNLANHGLHPRYQHMVANLPQLLGPAYPLLFFCYRRSFRLYSAVSAILVLSLFPHQEARFITPAIPLLLSSVRLPSRFGRAWIASWVMFNVIMGLLMGTYHQGGVVPMQIHISTQPDITHAFWWKTYSPPIWLLDGKNIQTSDMMGMPYLDVDAILKTAVSCGPANQGIVLAAPASATAIDRLINGTRRGLFLRERWRYSKHISLDDFDFEDEGVLGTLGRVLGRRGLVLWDIGRNC